VTDGLTADGLTFYHTPGHSPDELCIQFDGFMFTGDHVLPQISPHPSVSRSYSSFQSTLPESYRSSNEIYGLKALLRSLKRVAAMDGDIGVLPAHRAYYRSKFNLIGLERAGEIVDHHRQRCHGLIDILRRGPADLPSLTRDHFSHRELEDSNFFLALTEVMSHVELLQETGDVSVIGENGAEASGAQIRWNGTEAFDGFIDSL
jgi:glyoxylase-like metal-dependent hydrolase (beta-lactamase superfamily II)